LDTDDNEVLDHPDNFVLAATSEFHVNHYIEESKWDEYTKEIITDLCKSLWDIN